MNKTTLQIKETTINHPEDYQKGCDDTRKEIKNEIKKMPKFLWRDDVVKMLEEE